MRERSDEDVMRDVGAGDLDALGTLFARHHAHVHTLCDRLTGDPDAADDLVQEAFLRVLRYGRSFDGRSRFTTWLHRLVRNLCMDHLNATRRETERRARVAREAAHDAAPAEPDERAALVRQALDRLPPDKREVLVLSRYGELRYREIAEVLEVTVDTVKARAHRAMRELRRLFDELEQNA